MEIFKKSIWTLNFWFPKWSVHTLFQNIFSWECSSFRETVQGTFQSYEWCVSLQLDVGMITMVTRTPYTVLYCKYSAWQIKAYFYNFWIDPSSDFVKKICKHKLFFAPTQLFVFWSSRFPAVKACVLAWMSLPKMSHVHGCKYHPYSAAYGLFVLKEKHEKLCKYRHRYANNE